MKVKQRLWITDPQGFVTGRNINLSLTDPSFDMSDLWVGAGEIEVEIKVDADECVRRTIEALDKKEEEARAEFETKMNLLNQAKQELLCISQVTE